MSSPPIPPLLAVIVMLVVVLGLPLGWYALLTRRQRHAMNEIRSRAAERGWRFRRPLWSTNPTEFRVDGRSRSGLAWILESVGTRGYDKDWVVRLALRFPALGGAADVAVLPRDEGTHGPILARGPLPPETRQTVARFSGTLAGAVAFHANAREVATGLPAFDTAYQVMVLPELVRAPLVDRALAERLLTWPAGAIPPHSVLAWRDPGGFHLQVRLSMPPNWTTIAHTVAVAEEFSLRIPAPQAAPASQRLLDRLIARLMN